MQLEEELVTKLTNKKYTISIAESCTGGLISSTIVGVSGASKVLRCGFVTYAEEAKEKYVGVKRETLMSYGVVSEQVAAEMAQGCAKTAETEMGLSTTGIAGPLGGTEEKPVGLVYVGCYLKGKVEVRRYIFKGDRMKIREQAVEAALELAVQCLNNE